MTTFQILLWVVSNALQFAFVCENTGSIPDKGSYNADWLIIGTRRGGEGQIPANFADSLIFFPVYKGLFYMQTTSEKP